MGHTKAENDIAIEQIKKLNEKNPLKEYDVDSFVQGMRYGESKKELTHKLPDFLYEDEGQIITIRLIDSVVTDEWNDWKLKNGLK